MTDVYLIATGTSAPHIKAMAQEVHKQLRDAGIRCYRKSGTPDSDWMVADYVDFVVHLLSAEARSYYALEQLWSDAKRIEFPEAAVTGGSGPTMPADRRR